DPPAYRQPGRNGNGSCPCRLQVRLASGRLHAASGCFMDRGGIESYACGVDMSRHRLRPLPLFLIPQVLAACGGGGAVGPDAPAPVFPTLALGAGSIAVELGRALQLTATPRDQYGAAISGLPAPAWTIEDTAIAEVIGGAVNGKSLGNTRVFVTLTGDGVTHGDTATVSVLPATTGGPALPIGMSGTTFVP